MSSADILENYDGEEVIVLGEDHLEQAHYELKEEAIYRTIPRHVLYEGLEEEEPEQLDRIIDGAYPMSLRGVQNYFEENYEDGEFLADEVHELYEETQKLNSEETQSKIRDGKIPQSYNEFMDMPFFRMNNNVRDLINDSIGERTDYELNQWRKWIDNTDLPEGVSDEKIVDLLNMQSTIDNMPYNMREELGSLIRPINHLRQEGFEVDLAGCDINKREEYSDDSERHFDRTSYESVEEFEKQMDRMKANPEKAVSDLQKDLELAEKVASEEERNRRDQAMAERISRFHKNNDTDRAVMAVVGANHMEGVVQNLEDAEVSVYKEDLREIEEPTSDSEKALQYTLETIQKINEQ